MVITMDLPFKSFNNSPNQKRIRKMILGHVLILSCIQIYQFINTVIYRIFIHISRSCFHSEKIPLFPGKILLTRLQATPGQREMQHSQQCGKDVAAPGKATLAAHQHGGLWNLRSSIMAIYPSSSWLYIYD